MTGLQPPLPGYDKVLGAFMGRVINEIISLDPILGRIPWHQPSHIGEIRRSGSSYAPETEFTDLEHDCILQNDLVRIGDVEAFVECLCEMGLGLQDQMHRNLIQLLSDSGDSFGASIDLGGRLVTWEDFFELLENFEVTFDSNNMMIGEPVIMSSPAMVEALESIPRPTDFDERVNTILRRKLERQLAEKRTRRLSE